MMALKMDDIIDMQISKAVRAILRAHTSGEEDEAFTVFKLKSMMLQATKDDEGFFVALV